jgi:site-specific DNA recombinase
MVGTTSWRGSSYSTSSSRASGRYMAAQARYRDGHADRRAEHGAIHAQIKAKETAIERYHLAFENGTMDDTTVGDRLKFCAARSPSSALAPPS